MRGSGRGQRLCAHLAHRHRHRGKHLKAASRVSRSAGCCCRAARQACTSRPARALCSSCCAAASQSLTRWVVPSCSRGAGSAEACARQGPSAATIAYENGSGGPCWPAAAAASMLRRARSAPRVCQSQSIRSWQVGAARSGVSGLSSPGVLWFLRACSQLPAPCLVCMQDHPRRTQD